MASQPTVYRRVPSQRLLNMFRNSQDNRSSLGNGRVLVLRVSFCRQRLRRILIMLSLSELTTFDVEAVEEAAEREQVCLLQRSGL